MAPKTEDWKKTTFEQIDLVVLCCVLLKKFGPVKVSQADIAKVMSYQGKHAIVSTPSKDGKSITVELKQPVQ